MKEYFSGAIETARMEFKTTSLHFLSAHNVDRAS